MTHFPACSNWILWYNFIIYINREHFYLYKAGFSLTRFSMGAVTAHHSLTRRACWFCDGMKL